MDLHGDGEGSVSKTWKWSETSLLFYGTGNHKSDGTPPELHEYIHSSLSSVILEAERERCRKTLKHGAGIIGTPLQSMPY